MSENAEVVEIAKSIDEPLSSRMSPGEIFQYISALISQGYNKRYIAKDLSIDEDDVLPIFCESMRVYSDELVDQLQSNGRSDNDMEQPEQPEYSCAIG